MMTLKSRRILGLIAGMAMMGVAAPSLMAQADAPRGKTPAASQPEKDHKDKDAKPQKDARESNKDGNGTVTIGQTAPAFELKDTEGKTVKLSDFAGKVVVLEWFNPECPYVVKHHGEHKTMVNTYAKYKDKGVVWLAINSGAPGKQGAGLELNAQHKKDWKMEYPILLDESGKVGKAYGSKNTPTMFIIDASGKLAYMGAIDNDNSAKKLGSINYVDQALGQILAKETVSSPVTKAYGCSVKYGGS
ncbi:MAG: redoxin domain-containing protein [Phycisphaeraceae bacterium]|nr:redoxin domain-containing protein [Phycisphaeraceae bacterium]